MAKILITSCFTISQPYLTYKTSQKKALCIWTYHSKSVILAYIQYILIWDELSRGVLTKIFFQKVHTILNIFHIYHFALKWILPKLQAIEISSKNVILSLNLSKIFTSGLAQYYLQWYGKYPNTTFAQNRVFWHFFTFLGYFWPF